MADPDDIALLSREEVCLAAKVAPPSVPGIYFLLLAGHVVYVGRSVCIGARIGTHAQDGRIPFDSWAHIECPEQWQTAMESKYIREFSPAFNRTIPSSMATMTFPDIMLRMVDNKVVGRKVSNREKRIKKATKMIEEARAAENFSISEP